MLDLSTYFRNFFYVHQANISTQQPLGNLKGLYLKFFLSCVTDSKKK